MLPPAPEVAFQVNGVLFIKNNPLQQQALLLNLIPFERLQGYFTFSIYNPMPGKLVGGGTGMQDPGYLPGGARVAGQGRDKTVRNDLAGRDLSDQGFYLLGERAGHGHPIQTEPFAGFTSGSGIHL